MLEEMAGKIKSGEDLTFEEAEKVYWETKEIEFHKLEKEQRKLHAWFSAVADVLKKDRKSMNMRKKVFVTAVPIFTGSSEYKPDLIEIRKLLPPEKKIRAAYLFNIDVDGKIKESGIKAQSTKNFIFVECDRMGLVERLFDKSGIKWGSINSVDDMSNYINELKKHGKANLKKPPKKGNIGDVLGELLRINGVPFAIVNGDCIANEVGKYGYEQMFLSEDDLGIKAFEVYENFGYASDEKTKEDVMERFYEFMTLSQDDGR